MRLRIAPGSANQRVHVRPREIVERARLSYLAERGWVPHGQSYRGQFRTNGGAWHGEVGLKDRELQFFILDPPNEVHCGPHRDCFFHIGKNWWLVHFREKPTSPDDGIMAMEHLLEYPNEQ